MAIHVEPPAPEVPAHSRGHEATLHQRGDLQCPDGVTTILRAASGDPAALDEVVPIVVGQLRRIAQGLLRTQNYPVDLEATELVSELYSELVGIQRLPINRRDLLALSATIMRRIIVRDLRKSLAAKREGELGSLPLEYAENVAKRNDLDLTDLLSLDCALDELGRKAPRLRSVVELRFFVGCTTAEIADTLQVSPATVKRTWSLALRMLQELVGDSPVAPRLRSTPCLTTSSPADGEALSHALAAAAPADLGNLAFLERPLGHLAGGHMAATLEGRRMGKYLVTRRIADGGSSEVYRAKCLERGNEQPYAIKVLRPELMESQFCRAMFRQEFDTRDLEVPGLVPIVDHGVSPCGRPFLVTPFIQGISITGFCSTCRPGIGRRLRLFDRLCWIVSNLHRAGTIHCDLKPANVLITPREHVRVIDLGIARRGWDRGLPSTRGLTAFTRTYASPEQMRGEPPTPATDLFALGVILYELLCGSCPRAASSLRALTDEILGSPAIHMKETSPLGAKPNGSPTAPYRATAWRTTLASRLARILQRLLAQTPLDRGTLEELRADLARAQGRSGVAPA